MIYFELIIVISSRYVFMPEVLVFVFREGRSLVSDIDVFINALLYFFARLRDLATVFN
jgi:hypothetical protein